jgi:hypothetical protein
LAARSCSALTCACSFSARSCSFSGARLFFFRALLFFFRPRLFPLSPCLFPLSPRLFPLSPRLFGFGLQLFQVTLDTALFAQIVLACLVGVIGAVFVGEGFQGAHGLPHFVGVHPGRQGAGVESFAFGEELQPAFLFGVDGVGVEFVQFQQPDAAVVEQQASGAVAQAKVVDALGALLGQQVFAQQPDGVGGFEGAVVFAAVELGAVEVGPGVEDAREQVAVGEELDFDLVQAAELVARLDVDDAEFVVEEFLVVVGVEDFDFGDGGGERRAEDGVEEVDQQGAVGLRAEQGLEDAVDLGVDGDGSWVPESSREAGD